MIERESQQVPSFSNNITPQQRRLPLDEVSSNVPGRFSRDKYLDPARLDYEDDTTSNLERRERKLDEQFKNLLERCNRSKEYIENINKLTSPIDKGLLSPPSTAIQYKSPTYSQTSTANRPLRELDLEPSRNEVLLQKTSDFPPRTADFQLNTAKSSDLIPTSTARYDNPDNYSRLEREILELKKTVMEKLKLTEDATNKENKKGAKYDSVETQESEEDYLVKKQPQREREREREKEQPEKPSQTTFKKPHVRTATSPTAGLRSVKSPKAVHSPRSISITSPKDTRSLKRKEEEDKKKTEKSLIELHETLKEKEKIQHEKYVTLKVKYKELKNIFREINAKNAELADQLQRKDSIIADFEELARKSQEEILRNVEIIKELRRREEILTRSEEEARSTVIEYKARLGEQRETLEKIEESIRDNEEKYRIQLERLVSENSQLKSEVAALKEKEVSIREKHDVLTSELQACRHEIENKDRTIHKYEEQINLKDSQLRNLNQQLEKMSIHDKDILERLEEANNTIQSLEEKVAQMRKKFDEEKSRILEERDKEVAQKKEKNKILKEELAHKESLYNKLNEENRRISHDYDRVVSEKMQLQKEYDKLKEALDNANQEMYLFS